MMVLLPPIATTAAVGTLPELQDTSVVLQGITVTVADQSQLQSMITFLRNAFDFKVLRQTTEGTVTNTVCRQRVTVYIRVVSMVQSSSELFLLHWQPSSVVWLWSRTTQHPSRLYRPSILVQLLWWTRLNQRVVRFQDFGGQLQGWCCRTW
jgi:hypothetical protein